MLVSSRVVLLALLLLFLAPLWPGPARADEEDEAAWDLVTRLFHVGALTQGRSDFFRGTAPVLGPDDVVDSGGPLFGWENEEPRYPFGQVDELIEFLKTTIQPDTWHSIDGADMHNLGEQIILARSMRTVLDELAAFLADLERQVMTSITVEMHAVQLDHAAARALAATNTGAGLDAERVKALLVGSAVGPHGRLTTFSTQQASLFSGRQWSYVCDYDVEVAEEAAISDPIVNVASLGLSAEVRPTLHAGGKSVLLALDAFVSRLHDTRVVKTGEEGRTIEFPDHVVTHVCTRALAPAGGWILVDGQPSADEAAGWFLLVRATPNPPDGLEGPARAVPLDAPAKGGPRTLEMRTFDVGSFGATVQSRGGQEINLVPSNFTPPEPPELPEPMPIFPEQILADLLRSSIAPGSWNLQGTYLGVRGSRLFVRNTRAVLDAIATRLAELHHELLWSVVANAEVIEMDAALARTLGRGAEASSGAVLLSPQQRKALDEALASGAAQRLQGARITSLRGARNAIRSGKHFTYLSDFECELAKGVVTSNPVIRSCLSGLQVDLQPSLTSGCRSLQMEVRMTRTQITKPIREVSTPHGPIECPELAVFRLRTSLQIPLGRTAVVAASGKDGRSVVLLLTPELSRPAK